MLICTTLAWCLEIRRKLFGCGLETVRPDKLKNCYAEISELLNYFTKTSMYHYLLYHNAAPNKSMDVRAKQRLSYQHLSFNSKLCWRFRPASSQSFGFSRLQTRKFGSRNFFNFLPLVENKLDCNATKKRNFIRARVFRCEQSFGFLKVARRQRAFRWRFSVDSNGFESETKSVSKKVVCKQRARIEQFSFS